MNPPGAPISPQLAQTASEWFARVSDASVTRADLDAWQHWRRAHPEHERAWQAIEQVLQRFSSLDSGAAGQALRTPPANRRKALRSLLTVGFVVSSGWLGARHLPWQAWTAEQQTAQGERREMRLEDGTQLVLNTATAIQVRYSASLRQVQLVRGELFVTTAPDAQARRFVLATSLADLVPLGTRFSVRVERDWMRLSVHEGAVRIEQQAHTVHAGETVELGPHGMSDTRANAAGADAWTRGVLVADNMRLADFVAELGRYRAGRLVCDPAVAELRLSGSFPLQRVDDALAAVAQTLPVRVVQVAPLWTRIEAR